MFNVISHFNILFSWSLIEEVPLNFDTHVGEREFLRHATPLQQSILQFLEPKIPDGAFIQVDHLEVLCGVTLDLDHLGDGVCSLVPNFVALKT